MVDDLVDNVASRIRELRDNDFEPTTVLVSPEIYKELRENLPDDEEEQVLAIDFDFHHSLEDLKKDFVVCFEDKIDDSPMALPNPRKIHEEIVEPLDFEDLDPEVAREHGFDGVEEGDKSLKVELFTDVQRKGIEFYKDNLEDLNIDHESLPLEEEEKEADDDFTESIEFAVVSSNFQPDEDLPSYSGEEQEEDFEQAMRSYLTLQIAKTIYEGEFSYPFSYKPAEKDEKVRIGREYLIFDKILMPERGEED